MMRTVLLAISLLVLHFGSNAKEARPSARMVNENWKAMWISAPNCGPTDFGVYHFRKKFTITSIPETFIVNASADNRYILYVNGTQVSRGPARGDMENWNFETIDIAPYLKTGENLIASVVWNFGQYAPLAQFTLRTGFILSANGDDAQQIVNSDHSWKVVHNKAYAPLPEGVLDVGCGEIIDASSYPWGWEQPLFDDSQWENAVKIGDGGVYGVGTGYNWVLVPRDIPQMEEQVLRMGEIRRASMPADNAFLNGDHPLVVPKNSEVTLLIDQKHLTTAYPVLNVSKGKGASIELTYAEALTTKEGKGNRNEVEGRTISGNKDRFIADGGEQRRFQTLWFRTYRYVEVKVKTADENLIINDLYGIYTGYPFQELASFECDDPRLKEVWRIGWRTARLCAHETYFDCPYYEQLQYIGDTRIQSLISLYVSGDNRLMRRAIRLFDVSRHAEGITQSRYPSRQLQYIPPFSLYWVNMIHDYYMHCDDEAFVRSSMSGIKTVLDWYEKKVDPKTGMLGAVPHWNFVDWATQWNRWTAKPTPGLPEEGMTGGASVTTLQFAYALNDAVALFRHFGDKAAAEHYEQLRQRLCKSTYTLCWNAEKGMMADQIGHTSYSQHANIMAILSDAVPTGEQRKLYRKTDSDPSLIQATYYYRFYLFRAMKKVGLADQYTTMLQPWYDMLNVGLTTFAENPEPTRSDCHAWSSSPNYDFLATVCGVEPAEPGFKSVRVAPHLGHLKRIKGVVPHPKGEIIVELHKEGEKTVGKVTLPAGLTGTYVMQGKTQKLLSGENAIR